MTRGQFVLNDDVAYIKYDAFLNDVGLKIIEDLEAGKTFKEIVSSKMEMFKIKVPGDFFTKDNLDYSYVVKGSTMEIYYYEEQIYEGRIPTDLEYVEWMDSKMCDICEDLIPSGKDLTTHNSEHKLKVCCDCKESAEEIDEIRSYCDT